MTDRLAEIKQLYDMELAVENPNSPAVWLIKEVERLRAERTEVIEELARRYGGMFASPGSEPSTTEVFREAQQLAQQRVRKARNGV
jgi:hypothetical protein